MSESQFPTGESTSVTPETSSDESSDVTTESAEAAAQEATGASPAVSKAPEAKVVQKLQNKIESGAKLTKTEEKQLKEYKLKVNGRERTVKFDPSNDEEVIRYLQKAEASDSKFEEAAQVKKAAVDFITQLRTNPRAVLSDPNIGIDLKKFAEEIINNEIQEMEKTPEQREREKLQRELESLKKQAKDKEDSWKKQEFSRLQAEQERNLETDISAALDIGGIPKTPRTVKAMAEMMMIALQNGVDLSAKDIAPLVKNTTVSEFKEIVNSLSDDQLEDFLGKEVLGRLRKKNVAKAKAVQTANAIKPTGQDQQKKAQEAKPSKKITYRDFFGT